jgi:hypothetical protein
MNPDLRPSPGAATRFKASSVRLRDWVRGGFTYNEDTHTPRRAAQEGESPARRGPAADGQAATQVRARDNLSMAHFVRSTALALAMALCSRAANLPPGWLETALEARLAAFAKTAGMAAKPVGTRDLTNAALLHLMTGGDAARAEAWIERAYATQDMNPTSATFGELKWATGDAGITDLNAIEFGAQAMGPLYLTYRDRLSEGFRKRMAPHLAAALTGLRGHKVAVSYTNIFLMNLVSGMLIGQAVGDGAAVRKAEEELAAWLDYTRRNGIHEFDSPTYYSTDLDSLVEGLRYAANPEDRRSFERALDYFWTDIAASYFPAGQRLAGAYSRDYDFLRGRGGMDVWLTDAGWASLPQAAPDFEKVFVLDNQRPGGYRPKPEAAALSRQLPREVVSAWDDDPGHSRYLWVGRALAIGCTSGDYNAQDKLFSVTFAGPADLAQISIVPDVFDAPYGLVRNPDRTGHMKPTHLPLHAACVESGGVALVALDLDPSAAGSGAHGLATNLLLPAGAAIAVDGKREPMAAPGTVAVRRDAVITVGMGDAEVAIRLLHADGLPEQKPALTLEADADGLAHHAVRLKLAHLSEGRETASKHLRVAFLVAARDGAQVRAVTATSEIRDGVWTVKAGLAGLSLEVAREAGDRKRILRQRVNGEPIPRSLLSVDGKDLAGALLR